MKIPKEVGEALAGLPAAAMVLVPDLIRAARERDAQRVADAAEELGRREAFDRLMSERAKAAKKP